MAPPSFDAIVSKTWGIDDDVIDLTSSSYSGALSSPEKAKDVPKWYKDALRAFLLDHPDDTSFIVTTGDGDGFGSVMCVEESCYADVALGRDRALADGGRARGFGSLEQYAEHVTEPEHVAGRVERVAKLGPGSDVGRPSAAMAKCELKIESNGSPGPPSASSSAARPLAVPKPSRPTALPAFPSLARGPTSVKLKRSFSSSPEPISPPPPHAGSSLSSAVKSASGPPAKKARMNLEILELSDSDDDFLSRDKRATLDSFLGLTGKAKVPAKPAAARKSHRPELAVKLKKEQEKGKDRALAASSSASPAPAVKEQDRVADAWAMREVAAADEREKEQARADVERLDAADRARNVAADAEPMQGVMPAVPGAYNAVAGPSNVGAAAAADPAVDAALLPLPVPAPAPAFVAGSSASVNELKLMRDECNVMYDIASAWTTVHPAWKAVNPSWMLKYTALMTRMSQLHHSTSRRQRIAPADQALLAFPGAVVEPAAAAIPPATLAVTRLNVERLRGLFVQLAEKDRLLANAYTRAPPAAAPNFGLGGLGYDGALGYGDADPYGDTVGSLGRLLGAGAGLGRYGDEVGNPLFRQPGDLKEFFDIAAQDFEDSEVIADAALTIGLKDHLKDRIDGLAINLMPHQVIGVAWMKRKEDDKKLRGGILADDMGLGKTVQALGLMVLNRGPARGAVDADGDPKPRATLIVCPFALIDQWKLEIQTKCKPGLFKIHVQHGKDKLHKTKQLEKYDVIITTYATLVGDFPDERKHVSAQKKRRKARKMADSSESDTNSEDDREARSKGRGPLATMRFHRVILDEAQQIRNRQTRAAQACFAVAADHRWALTGTPVTNGLEDLFSLLKFVGVRPWNDWTDFNHHIAKLAKKKPDVAASRAQAVLKGCLLRRSKDSKIDGKPILQLKEKTIVEDVLDFSPEERKIYDMLEKRSRATFNKFLRKGTVMKNYTQVLTLLLRMRQAANHPILLVRAQNEIRPGDVVLGGDEDADAEDAGPAGAAGPVAAAAAVVAEGDGVGALKGQKAEDFARATTLCGAEWVTKQRATMLARAVESAIAELEGEEIDEDNYACPVCMEDCRISEEVITACGHLFCRTCITDVHQQNQVQAQQQGDQQDNEVAGKKPCPSCRTPYDMKMVFTAAMLEPTDEDVTAALKKAGKVTAHHDDVAVDDGDDEEAREAVTARLLGASLEFGRDDEDVKPFISTAAKRGSTSSKGKGKARVLDSDDEDFDVKNEDPLQPWWVGDRISMDPRHRQHRRKLYESLGLKDDDVIEPSTKMKAMLRIIREQAAKNPEDKIIVYSQWTTMLDLVADFLRKEKVSHDLYDGRMNRKEREETIRAFDVRNNPQVLLISLKCGGVGLNLVRANRVINLDLAWNAATETQARDRVHRLGQHKEVFVNRLIIAESVEQRILQLQARKQEASDSALGEGSGQKLKKLTVKDLQALFG